MGVPASVLPASAVPPSEDAPELVLPKAAHDRQALATVAAAHALRRIRQAYLEMHSEGGEQGATIPDGGSATRELLDEGVAARHGVGGDHGGRRREGHVTRPPDDAGVCTAAEGR